MNWPLGSVALNRASTTPEGSKVKLEGSVFPYQAVAAAVNDFRHGFQLQDR
jgi:hypothetical protein